MEIYYQSLKQQNPPLPHVFIQGKVITSFQSHVKLSDVCYQTAKRNHFGCPNQQENESMVYNFETRGELLGDVIDITSCSPVIKFTWHNCITMRRHANTQAKECRYV